MHSSFATRFLAAALCLAALATPALAQEATQPGEYGQGAGVQHARSLPRTGEGPAREEPAVPRSYTQLLLLGPVLGAGFLLAHRRRARGRFTPAG